jgi:hypothetical protein
MRRFSGAMVRLGLVFGALGASIALMATPSPVAAASGYPPPPIVNTDCSFSQVIDVGSSFTLQVSCTFAADSSIVVTLNGSVYATFKTVSGILTETFKVTDPHISMNGGPSVATNFGAVNSFVAAGTNPSGGTNVATTLISIPTAAAATPTATTGPLAFTGADLAATIIGGLALLVMGGLLTVYARRRATRNASAVTAG